MLFRSTLREAGIRTPILVVGGALDQGFSQLVEYALTPTGRKLARIIAQLQQLDATHVVVRGRKHAP